MHLQRVLTIITVGLAAASLLFAGCGKDKGESGKDAPRAGQQSDTTFETTAETNQLQPKAEDTTDLPRLVDLGKGTCIPCKKMAPILEELKTEYRGKAVVEVIDLRDDPGAAGEYGIRIIPTQIFFDAMGNEVWRHEGFLGRNAIVAKFAEMGVEPIDN